MPTSTAQKPELAPSTLPRDTVPQRPRRIAKSSVTPALSSIEDGSTVDVNRARARRQRWRRCLVQCIPWKPVYCSGSLIQTTCHRIADEKVTCPVTCRHAVWLQLARTRQAARANDGADGPENLEAIVIALPLPSQERGTYRTLLLQQFGWGRQHANPSDLCTQKRPHRS